MPTTRVSVAVSESTDPPLVPAARSATHQGVDVERTNTAVELAHKPDEEPWTRAEVAEVVEELTSQRDRLERAVADLTDQLGRLMRDSGDGAGHDTADIGASAFERDHEIVMINKERQILAEATDALERIADGSYGVCARCGEPVGKMRMMAFPRATLCMTCKQREERR